VGESVIVCAGGESFVPPQLQVSDGEQVIAVDIHVKEANVGNAISFV